MTLSVYRHTAQAYADGTVAAALDEAVGSCSYCHGAEEHADDCAWWNDPTVWAMLAEPEDSPW